MRAVGQCGCGCGEEVNLADDAQPPQKSINQSVPVRRPSVPPANASPHRQQLSVALHCVALSPRTGRAAAGRTDGLADEERDLTGGLTGDSPAYRTLCVAR